jgi:hypothetical protein
MSEIIASLGKGNIFWLAIVGGAVFYGVAVAIVQAWRRVRLTEIDAALKQHMLEKGMSPDDIERVVRASSRSSAGAGESSSEGDESRTELIQNLAENGMSSEDIERILRAMQNPNGADGLARKEPAKA